MIGLFIVSYMGRREVATMPIEPGKVYWGALAPLAYEPYEVKITMFFNTQEEADKFKLNPIYKPFHGWKCKVPNNDMCEYNVLKDPAMDSCIHCGQPHLNERK